MKNTIASLTLICILMVSAQGFSEAPSFPAEMKTGASTLVLNGVGIRKATIFALRVYFAGLYLEKKSKDSDAIINSKEVKRVDMKFVRSVKKKDIVEAWDKGLKNNCPADCEKIAAPFTKFEEVLSDVGEGDMMSFDFSPGKVEYLFNNAKKATFENEAFAKSVLATWIGKNPPNKDLKEGLLGL